jgi:putative endonuclease
VSEATPEPTWWLYLLACRDGRTYAGIALDVEARFRAHRAGRGSKFTRSNPPVKILRAQSFATKSEAMKAEHALKRLNRVERLEWAAQLSTGEALIPSLPPRSGGRRVG